MGAAARTAGLINTFLGEAATRLANEAPGNMILLRGFDEHTSFPSMQEVFKLTPACIATYPMYKGLARLVGMEIVGQPASLEEEIDVLQRAWDDYDFFFVHFKYTDSRGEDGDFTAKVQMIEQFDAIVPRVTALGPDVLVVTGDHSTPSALASHSWHPVPTLLVGQHCRTDGCTTFGETAALGGALGQFEAVHLMPLMLANAGRLEKFGA